MQCAECRAVYADVLDSCPACEQAVATRSEPPASEEISSSPSNPIRTTDDPNPMNAPADTQTTNANGSTLIEFPGISRNRPQWRKELSERVREIQQRRAREAALEAGQEPSNGVASVSLPVEQPRGEAQTDHAPSEGSSKQLGLVPQPEEPEVNPIVAAALRRIERARTQTPPPPRPGSPRKSSAAAVARAQEEDFAPQPEAIVARAAEPSKDAPELRKSSPTETRDAAPDTTRPGGLIIVPTKQAPAETPQRAVAPLVPPAAASRTAAEPNAVKAAQGTDLVDESVADSPAAGEVVGSKPKARRIEGVIDESWLEKRGIELLPKVAVERTRPRERAAHVRRVAAAVADLFVVALISAPFAAVIELTFGDWTDLRVLASMAGIVLVVQFLYLTCATAITGRTAGMKLFSLYTVDVRTGLIPTTGQCARRALIYLLSLATLGLGILYALFNQEGHAAHDILSKTAVVGD